MIPIANFKFFINAAFEIIALLFTMMIFVSCLLQKKTNSTKRSFCVFTLNLILLLICNLTTWILDGINVTPSYHPGLYKLDLVLTVFDFFFYCLALVLFYYYLTASMSDIGIGNKTKRNRLITVLVIQCFISGGIFASSVNNGWLYTFAPDGYTYYHPSYWILVALSVPALWISFYTVIKYRKELKKRRTFLYLSYLIVPFIMLIFDQLFSLSLSYISVAMIVSAIYIDVDIQQSREFLEQEAEIAKQKVEMTEMKVNLMMSQIQPHFLYNTLSTITYFCRKDPKEAEKTVSEFSDYLRANLRSINALHPILFEAELNHVENYLKIQQRRFPHQMNIEYDIKTTDFRIPALTLQSIVENAVRHGVEASFDMTTIIISSYETDNSFIVSIKDNGPGFDVAKAPDDGRPHIGIASVKARLENMVKGSLQIESEPGKGTNVIITIPKDTEV